VARRLMAVLALAAAACDNPLSPTGDLEDARRTWSRQGITSYRFTVNVLCFCISRGPFAVVVERGSVTSVTDPATGEPRTPDAFVPLTVEALFAKVEDAIESDADEIDVRYHATLGYPEEIAIDFIERAIDDEVTYTASDLAAR
jgi:uncharacterized protein DUF6174